MTPFLSKAHPIGRNYALTALFGSGATPASDPLNSEKTHLNFYIPLYHLFNVFGVYDKVIKGCPLEIELFCTNDKVRILRTGTDTDGNPNTGAPKDSVLKWVNAGISLLLPRIVPSPMTEALLNRQLIAGLSIPIKFEKSYVYRESVTTATGPGQWRIVNTASRPTKVVLFMVPQDGETSQERDLYAQHSHLEPIGTQTSVASWIKSNLFVNGRKVPSEDVRHNSNKYGLKDHAQLYRMLNESQHNYDSPYLRNFGMEAGLNPWWNTLYCPLIVFDLSKRELSEFVGGASEIVVDYELKVTTGAQFLYAIVFTESELTLNMTEHYTLITVR